jgi:hypothetical protein
MERRFPLRCLGRDGATRAFDVKITPDEVSGDEVLHIQVFPPSELDVGHWFDLTLKKRSLGSYQIGTIDRNKREYGGQGIPDALLPELANRLSVEIWSSVKWNEADPSERRTEDADKMWARLVAKGLAAYVVGEGRYRCTSARVVNETV